MTKRGPLRTPGSVRDVRDNSGLAYTEAQTIETAQLLDRWFREYAATETYYLIEGWESRRKIEEHRGR
jgi:hypothetical protein